MRCKLSRIEDASEDNCPIITIFPPKYFYPIPFPQWEKFFVDRDQPLVTNLWNESYAIHIWNKLSANTSVKIGSGVPYELAVKENCPRVYELTRNSTTTCKIIFCAAIIFVFVCKTRNFRQFT